MTIIAYHLYIGVPSCCLSQEALKRFNCSSVNIPVYDYNTDEVQDNSDNNTKDENNNEEIPNRTNSSRRKKRKAKKKSNKKHKSK